MQYILDSDALSILSNPESPDKPAIGKYLASLGQEAVISVCILTIYEFEFSIAHCKDKQKKEHLQQVLETAKKNFSTIGLGFEDATIYGTLKNKFKEKTGIEQKNLKRHNIDIILASVAIAHSSILVSKDKIYKEHLSKIDNRLITEHW